MAAVTICSDFGAQKNKVWHCFPIYYPWSGGTGCHFRSTEKSQKVLILWLQSPSAVILEPKKIKTDTVSTVFPSISHDVMGPHAMIFVFWMLSIKPTFSLSSFTFIKRLFHFSSLSAIRVVSSAFLRLLIFLSAVLFPACASFSPTFLMMYPA